MQRNQVAMFFIYRRRDDRSQGFLTCASNSRVFIDDSHGHDDKFAVWLDIAAIVAFYAHSNHCQPFPTD